MTVGEATQLRVIQCDRAMATASASIRVARQLSFNFPSMVWGPCPPPLGSATDELVDRLDGVNRKYSLFINVDKTKVLASNSIACRILLQNEQPEQVDTFPYLGSLITEDGKCTTEFRTRLNRGQVIGALLQKIWKSHSIPISTKI